MIKKVSLRSLYKLGLGKRGNPLFIKCYVEKKDYYFDVKLYPNFLAKILLIILFPISILLYGVSSSKEIIKDIYEYICMGVGKKHMSKVVINKENNSNIYKYLNSLFE